MALSQGSSSHSTNLLQEEAKRIAQDPLFCRAHVQKKLLFYLVDRAAEGRDPPSQYEIAVEGLGKDPDYNVDQDSYPRVQVSRLRRNLKEYYKANGSPDSPELQIDVGTYEAVLVEAVQPNDPVIADPPVVATDTIAAERKLPTRIVGSALLGIIGLFTIPFLLLGVSPAVEARSNGKPITALSMGSDSVLASLDLPEGLAMQAQQIAEIQLASSFVSKPLKAGDGNAQVDFTVQLNFAPSGQGETELHLALVDEAGDIIFTDYVPYSASQPEVFTAELEASLVYITSPTGSIAQAKLSDVGDSVASDYSCFLAIENRRSNGADVTRLVDQCIERFPESSYQSFWYARRAFSAYQAEILNGGSIEKSGAAWDDLKRALKADRYNAFANFTAAKVELAKGNCSEADGYVGRALERGSSYPALVAALEITAAPCASSTADSRSLALRIRTLGEHNPEPDPLLHLYLIIGSLAAGDYATAKLVADRSVLIDPKGPVDETSDLLRRSLGDGVLARSSRKKLIESIRLFVWNDDATEAIADELINGTAQR